MQRFGDMAAPRDEAEDETPRNPLSPAERLLFAALRGWAGLRAAGRPPQDEVVPLLTQKASARASALFVAWIHAIEAACRGPLQIECPGCGGALADAQRLIVACGVSPVAPDMAHALLSPLLFDTQLVVQMGRRLNAALAADGWPLPARLADPQPVPDEPVPRTGALPTLH
ncbi:hypothetical protein [Phenylobacterium sp.]|uniref:hypothetical protein n=1 Tax=Phenylobacterium sp. TaxID=1871053 RepID=UPI0027262D98|nr:hypothetical protein [Phenylobacterium sp.]MDO8799963.1 hypothetical protein [Phenylobacterium sp.]